MYCGNNRFNIDVVNGTRRLGTRYSCLRTGIGKGLKLPLDKTYNGRYAAIDNRKIYCGNDMILPRNYDLVGNLPMCLQKGVGIGKKLKAERSRNMIHPAIIYTLFFCLINLTTFIIIFLVKPSFIKTSKNKIRWSYFLAIYFFLMLCSIFLIFLVHKFQLIFP